MIRFLDLQKINHRFAEELNEAVNKVLSSGWYLQGAENKEFESNYATFIGSKYCVGVATSINAARHVVQIVYPIDIKRNFFPVLHHADIPFALAMMAVQLDNPTVVNGEHRQEKFDSRGWRHRDHIP